MSSTQQVDVLSLFREGSRKMVAEQQATEVTKVGTLRAGNTGLLQADGTFTGKCPRITYLRYKGINVEGPDYSKELMFGGGRGNEDLWMEVLRLAGWKGPILREAECPIQWFTISGVKVTGRPDIVLCDKEPVHGIELKLVSSLWTARDVALVGKPKTDHLMQAGHYSWQLNVPFTICYTSRTNFAVTGWIQKQMPKQGEPGSEFCSYSSSGIKAVLPFVVAYEIRWVLAEGTEGLRLQYRRAETEGPFLDSIVTTASIERYYDHVALIDRTKDFGKRPSNLLPDGTKGAFNLCDYCPMQKVCDQFEGSYAKWMSAAYSLSSTL